MEKLIMAPCNFVPLKDLERSASRLKNRIYMRERYHQKKSDIQFQKSRSESRKRFYLTHKEKEDKRIREYCKSSKGIESQKKYATSEKGRKKRSEQEKKRKETRNAKMLCSECQQSLTVYSGVCEVCRLKERIRLRKHRNNLPYEKSGIGCPPILTDREIQTRNHVDLS